MDVKHCIRVLVFAGTLSVALASFSETNAVPVVTEIQTFRLHYVSATEIAEQINRLITPTGDCPLIAWAHRKGTVPKTAFTISLRLDSLAYPILLR